MSKSIYDEYLIYDRKRNLGIQKIYKFEKGLYELAVLDENGNLDYTTPITNDVIGWLTWEEVIELLRKIKELKNEK